MSAVTDLAALLEAIAAKEAHIATLEREVQALNRRLGGSALAADTHLKEVGRDDDAWPAGVVTNAALAHAPLQVARKTSPAHKRPHRRR